MSTTCDLALAGNWWPKLSRGTVNRKLSRAVVLLRDGQTIATGLSNEEGRVTFSGLSGGPCQLRIEEQITAVRLWTATAAPPVAVDQLLVVSDQNVQRAQQSLCHLCGQEPLMIGLLIAAAIAIPIAVHDSGS